MGNPSVYTRVTATGDVTTGAGRTDYLKSINVFGAAAVNAVVREGGSGGAIILTVGCGAGISNQWTSKALDGMPVQGGIHVTMSGAGEATVEY